MTEDFDLPRWQTQDSLSSSAALTTQHPSAPYIYPPPPPPQSQSLTGQQQRLQALQQSPTGGSSSQSSRQPPRISQLLEQEQQQGFSGSSPYSLSSHTSLNRSASLGGATGSASRGRRHHQPDDLEGAFHSDSQGLSSPRSSGPSQLQASLYPSSVAYHQAQSGTTTTSAASPAATSDGGYSDMYYNGGGAHTPKRSLTQHDSTRAAGRSPAATGNPASNPSLLDSYAQQSQYSPTTASSYSSPYAAGAGAPYHSHSRSHSQVKGEPMTPPMSSPYTPGGALSAYHGDPSSSPQPPALRQNSASTPNTPFPYAHASQSPYYQQDQAMLVDTPQHKRRASGFKRVRDARDLRPYVNPQPAGRRMGADGTYLSVRAAARLNCWCFFTC